MRRLFLLLCCGADLAGQESDLTSLSLEDFLNVEVTSVRRSRQKLPRAAAAVFVITQDDLRRSGAASLPEALRLAPGIHVARINGSLWAVGMRGFNGVTSDKLLVLVDGRTVYNPTMSGVVWADQMIPLEDVERIEVIRGTAGSVWGANAVNGVINVITRRSLETQGSLVAHSTGSMDLSRTTIRYGARHGRTLAWRTWFHHERNGQARTPGARMLAPWNTGRVGVRFDWTPGESDQWMFQAELTGLQRDLNVMRYPRPAVVAVGAVRGGGMAGFVLGQWTHTNRRGDQSQFRFSQDLQNSDIGIVRLGIQTFDADFQHSFRAGRHNLMAGGGVRVNQLTSEGTADFRFEPADRTYLVSNLFLQDEWEIARDRLVLTVGAKIEKYTKAGSALQPSARLMWTPTRRQAYWTAVSGAVRVPAHFDYATRYPITAVKGFLLPFRLVVQGSENVRPERVRGIEAGARVRAGKRAVLEAAAFHNNYRRLHGYQSSFPLNEDTFRGFSGVPPTAFPSGLTATLVNAEEGAVRGGEVSLHYDLHRNWRVVGAYSGVFANTRIRPGLREAMLLPMARTYPKHMVQVRSSWDLGKRWILDAEMYRTGEVRDSAMLALPAFTRADLRLERKLGESSGIYVNGQNLLRPRQREFVGDVVYPVGSIGRSITVGFRWER